MGKAWQGVSKNKDAIFIRSFKKCRISLDLSGSENNEINIEGIPDYKMQDIKILSSFILRVMTQTMMFMMMMTMSSKQKARSLSKPRRSHVKLTERIKCRKPRHCDLDIKIFDNDSEDEL